ncbi:FG-GAP repeat domain-containing protein [Streptomyces sp. NPDC021012]|uniref:FG-GAP repeat domain-containing protein n=1 Tax=Streptomyces sp. NPDC021012 TaxID=3365107 RepID=UPI0037A44BE9
MGETAGKTAAPEAEFEKTAFATAARTGQRVEIIDRREETAEFFANPDGSTTRRSYATPKWTRFEGQWRQTDPTLVKKSDGSIAPTAPAFSIAFSGGGSQPLATMVKHGKRLALSWPGSLPEPVISGDTVTYRSVLPGVDLKLMAEVDGFAQHLVVNTPEAAANPALRSIELGVQTDGVTLTETADHKLLAKDEAGETVFSAPAPKMWEQPATAPEEQQAVAAGMSTMMASAEASESEAPSSAPVSVDVSGNTLTLAPDPGLLATADQFPLVIDPPFSGGSREKWAVVYSATPSAAYPNGSGWNSSTPADEPRVGFNGDGDTRSFFAMNTNGLQGATITSAKFAVIQTHSWACSASTTGPMELWSAKDITTTPTWNSQGNYWGSRLDSDSFPGFNKTYCPENEPGHEFTSTALTNYVQQAANSGWDPLVFGLRVPDSYLGDVNSFKRFHNNPVLEVDYNFKPTVEASAAYEGSWVPSGEGNKPVSCGTAIGNSGVALTAKVSDRDGGMVNAVFSVKNSSGTAVSFAPNPNYKWVTSGQWASVTMPSKPLVDGTYTWSVYAIDGEGPDSAPTAACSFTVDTKGPSEAVKVLNTDGSPANEDGSTTNPDGTLRPRDLYPARKPVTLRLTHPAADVVGYCWADHYVSIGNGRCSNGTWVNAGTDANNTATVTFTPATYPYSTIYAVAYDAAGNHSPVDGGKEAVQLSTTKSEMVYEPGVTPNTEGAYPHDRRGDLNGDGYADFVATDTDGKLSFYAGNGTLGSLAPARNVGTGGWSGSLIAHGGDLANLLSPTIGPDGYEDFLVRLYVKDDDGQYRWKLFLYPGNGMGSPWVYTRQEINHPAQEDWLGLRQIVLPGNIDGKPGNDLITVECIWDNPKTRANCVNAQLLLYSGRIAADGSQDQTGTFSTTSTSLGTGGWRDFTNLAVDDINGDGIDDLVGREPTTGKLWLYPGKITGCPDSCTFSLGVRSEYGSGGWAQRPYLTSPGNIQGTVKSVTFNDEGTQSNFKQFEPTTGEGYGDIWATTPADPDSPVQYMDESGTWTSRLCPTGCLLTYPGGSTGHGLPHLSGTGGWATAITGIF